MDYGKECCDALMKRYKPEKLPPEGSLFYIQGVFLSGMQHIYSLSGDEKYFNYVKAYVDSTIGKNGELYGFCHELPIPAVAVIPVVFKTSRITVLANSLAVIL